MAIQSPNHRTSSGTTTSAGRSRYRAIRWAWCPASVAPSTSRRAIHDLSGEPEISFSASAWRRYRGLQTLRTGAPQEEVTLLIDHGSGNTRTVTVKRTGSMAGPAEPRPGQLAELEPGIYYVDELKSL